MTESCPIDAALTRIEALHAEARAQYAALIAALDEAARELREASGADLCPCNAAPVEPPVYDYAGRALCSVCAAAQQGWELTCVVCRQVFGEVAHHWDLDGRPVCCGCVHDDSEVCW